MKPFDQLTHLGRGRRLRPLVHDLLRRYGIASARLSQVRESVNIVFRVEAPGGRRCVLRMTPPWHFHGVRDVRSEIAWMRALSRETTIGLPAPIPDRNGDDVLTAAWPEIPGPWHCVLFSWVPGRQLAQRWTEANVERYGRLSARLHAHGRRFTPPGDFRIRTFANAFPHCVAGFENPERLVLRDDLGERLMPPGRREIFLETERRVQGEIDRLFRTDRPQPIHNDLHPWNVLVSREGLFALDFENCLLGFPVQDLGTTLHYMQSHFTRKLPVEATQAAFRRGYESIQPWPEQHPGQVAAMTAAHRLLLCNYYAASEDPEYQRFAIAFFEKMEAPLRAFLASGAAGSG